MRRNERFETWPWRDYGCFGLTQANAFSELFYASILHACAGLGFVPVRHDRADLVSVGEFDGSVRIVGTGA